MSDKLDVDNSQDDLLKSPTCTIALPERESPFRKKIRIETTSSSSGDRLKREEPVSDNAVFLKGLRQLRSNTDARVRGNNRSSESQGNGSPSSSVQSPAGTYEVETDVSVLARRSKQIEYGKITREYSNYIKAIPKEERLDFHPRTPNMKRKYSRRAWDGLIKQWRLNLHIWSDTPQPELDFSQNGIIRKRRIESGSDRTDSPDSSDVNPDEDLDSEVNATSFDKSGPKKRASFTDRINAEAESIFSKSWADEVAEYESELQEA